LSIFLGYLGVQANLTREPGEAGIGDLHACNRPGKPRQTNQTVPVFISVFHQHMGVAAQAWASICSHRQRGAPQAGL